MKRTLGLHSALAAIAAANVTIQPDSLMEDIQKGFFDDILTPGYVPAFEVFQGPKHDGDLIDHLGYDENHYYRYRSPGRSGGQQKSRDVAAGRAAEKRARKARAITRRNRK